MDLDRFFTRLNPLIEGVLRAPLLHWMFSPAVALLTVTGRRTGRRYAIPVGYQRFDRHIAIMVSKARRKSWWRNYREPGPVEILVKRRVHRGIARALPVDSAEFRSYAERAFKRLPWIAPQFGLRYDARTGLTAEQVAHLGRVGAIVEIELGPTDAPA